MSNKLTSIRINASLVARCTSPLPLCHRNTSSQNKCSWKAQEKKANYHTFLLHKAKKRQQSLDQLINNQE